MTDLAIAMTAAPRRKPTVLHALTSMRLAGFDEQVHVFAEPGTFGPTDLRQLDAKVRVHVNDTTRGCFGNWKHALEHLLAGTTAPWFLVVQDDAIWCTGAAKILHAQMILRQEPRTGFLSPYVTAKDVASTFGDGWNECRVGWTFWGALAFCLKRVAAEELLRHRRFRKHRGSQQVDAVVAASMLDLDRPSFVHVPSLVDHIGETSTLGHDDVAPRLRGFRFGVG